jgi:hypothetical protein
MYESFIHPGKLAFSDPQPFARSAPKARSNGTTARRRGGCGLEDGDSGGMPPPAVRRRRGVQRGALPHLASGGHGNDHQWLVRNASRPKRPPSPVAPRRRPVAADIAADISRLCRHTAAASPPTLRTVPPTFPNAVEGVHGGGFAVPLARKRGATAHALLLLSKTLWDCDGATCALRKSP